MELKLSCFFPSPYSEKHVKRRDFEIVFVCMCVCSRMMTLELITVCVAGHPAAFLEFVHPCVSV